MELLIKASALLIFSSVFGLLIRRKEPELALVLSLGAITLVFILTASAAGQFAEFVHTVDKLTNKNAALTYPVLKCLAIAVTTRLSAELCRDASQGAASTAIELTGSICALSVAMPLILSTVKTIGGLF